ncbi:MAG: potassium channel family protein [Bacillota bacterium]
MFIVIIGCGRTGSRLAGHLSSAGHDLVVVDQDESAFEDLPVEFSGFEITGNALMHKTLEEARLETADLCIIATHKDKVNFMISQLLKNKYPDIEIIVKGIEPKLVDIYDRDKVTVFSEKDILVDKIFDSIVFNSTKDDEVSV